MRSAGALLLGPVLSFLCVVTVGACSSVAEGGVEGAASAVTGGPTDECTAAGKTRCVSGRVATCKAPDPTSDRPTLGWGMPVECPDGQICRQDACTAVTPKQIEQATVVAQYANDLRDHTGYFAPLDVPRIQAEARRVLFLGDASDYAFAKAVHHVFRSFPQGHAAVGYGTSFGACSARTASVPLRGSSWYGVCGRAAGDASIVTYAAADNPMHLAPGDRIVRATKDGETWQSPGFLSRIGEEPVCDGSLPSKSARDDYAATNLFALLDEGATLDVVSPDGVTRTIGVPERTAASITCFDPLRRPARTKLFESSQRADGVVVMILPTLGGHADHPFPNPLTLDTYRDWVAGGIDLVRSDLGRYHDVRGLIWDLRGNSGGSQELAVGLIGASLLGATEGALARCYARLPGSTPPAFDETEVEYPFPYQVFVTRPLPSVGFEGRQAVVVDGTAYSAGDWMVLAAKKAAVPIVGHASAGAYGYTTGRSYVQKHLAPREGVHPGILSYISGAKCVDTSSGEPLEANAPVDHVVDFAPSDLARGRDTQLDAAAALLLR